MIVRSKYEKLNAALVLDGYRVGYVENPQRYAQVLLEGRKALKVSPISKDFIYSMTPSWLIAWVFSRHEEPSRSPFYQFFLQAKYRYHHLPAPVKLPIYPSVPRAAHWNYCLPHDLFASFSHQTTSIYSAGHFFPWNDSRRRHTLEGAHGIQGLLWDG